MPKRLPYIDFQESVVVSFNFAKVAESISLVMNPTAKLVRGKDTTPSAVLVGNAEISGTSVLQRVKGNGLKADYSLRCTVMDESGDTLVLAAILPVRDKERTYPPM